MGGSGPRGALTVLHRDGERVFASDGQSATGRLGRAWDDLLAKGWYTVSMKRHWKQVLPPPLRN